MHYFVPTNFSDFALTIAMTLPKLKRRLYYLRREWRSRSGPVLRVAAASLAAVVAVVLSQSALGARADSEQLKLWFRLRGPRPVPESITVIAMDPRTKQALGIPDRESIPRDVIANALLALIPFRPKAVIFDSLFQGAGPSPEADLKLAEAFAQTPSVIASSSLLDVEGRDTKGEFKLGRRRVNSLPLFVESAKDTIPMQLTLTGNVAEKIALLSDPTLEKVPLLRPLRKLIDPAIEQPGDFDLINYYGGPFSFPSMPLFRLLIGQQPPPAELLEEKILLVGWTDRSINRMEPDRRDSFLTPASPETMYGVEIQATIVGNLLDRTWLRRLPPEIESLLAALLALGLSLPATRLSWRRSTPVIVAGAGICLGASHFAFCRYYYFIPLGTVIGLVLPAFMMIAAFAESRYEEKRRRTLEGAIGLMARPSGGLSEENTKR